VTFVRVTESLRDCGTRKSFSTESLDIGMMVNCIQAEEQSEQESSRSSNNRQTPNLQQDYQKDSDVDGANKQPEFGSCRLSFFVAH
jgi:hypothetical protein